MCSPNKNNLRTQGVHVFLSLSTHMQFFKKLLKLLYRYFILFALSGDFKYIYHSGFNFIFSHR
jgi:hypothetical protein